MCYSRIDIVWFFRRCHNDSILFTCGIHCTKFEPFLKAIPTRKSETMRTKFCGNNFLGKGFRKTSADSFFLNSDVASGGGGVWRGILRLLLFLFWRNSGGLLFRRNHTKFLFLRFHVYNNEYQVCSFLLP